MHVACPTGIYGAPIYLALAFTKFNLPPASITSHSRSESWCASLNDIPVVLSTASKVVCLSFGACAIFGISTSSSWPILLEAPSVS